MQVDRFSRTALNVAFIRAQHHLHDEPKLLDDPYTHGLLTEAEMVAFAEAYVRNALELGAGAARRRRPRGSAEPPLWHRRLRT
jgi:O-methyltransferase involved in polyketide biosynthesis